MPDMPNPLWSCIHGFANPRHCSICSAPKGRRYTYEAEHGGAHRGKRRVKRVKHHRPDTWTPDARTIPLKVRWSPVVTTITVHIPEHSTLMQPVVLEHTPTSNLSTSPVENLSNACSDSNLKSKEASL